jgi:hypothetical protein
MWKGRLQKEYVDFEEFQVYDEIYGLAKRLGFDSAEEAWAANPIAQGSVNPMDYRRVGGKKLKKEDIDTFATPEEAEILKEYIGNHAPAESENAKLVLISVSGGVAEVIQKPKGVEVKIVDYDAESSGDTNFETFYYVDDEISGHANQMKPLGLDNSDEV